MTILLLILAATFSAAPLFAQPRHTWGLDEPSGTQVLDTAGGLSGFLMNGVERLPGGRAGGGIRCDGVDDYATIPDDDSIEAAEFSLAFWVRRRGDQPVWAMFLS
jgi:hypothetical protein